MSVAAPRTESYTGRGKLDASQINSSLTLSSSLCVVRYPICIHRFWNKICIRL